MSPVDNKEQEQRESSSSQAAISHHMKSEADNHIAFRKYAGNSKLPFG